MPPPTLIDWGKNNPKLNWHLKYLKKRKQTASSKGVFVFGKQASISNKPLNEAKQWLCVCVDESVSDSPQSSFHFVRLFVFPTVNYAVQKERPKETKGCFGLRHPCPEIAPDTPCFPTGWLQCVLVSRVKLRYQMDASGKFVAENKNRDSYQRRLRHDAFKVICLTWHVTWLLIMWTLPYQFWDYKS